MKEKIVGLDLSLTGTGVAWGYQADKETVTITSKNKDIARLMELRRVIFSYCQDADLVVLEDYAYSRAGAHSHQIGELGGIIKLELADHDVPFATVVPTIIKKFATGKGNANKSEMILASYKLSRQEFIDDNRCDAWWLRSMGAYYLGDKVIVSPNSYRDEALKKVTWP